jgi:restriction endonuclease S subunit
MNEVAFEVLLTDAQSSTAIVGLRKLILTAALRGEFDIPSEREFQLRKALQTINSPVFVKEAVGGRKPKRIAEVGTADSIAVGSAADRFVVDLGDIATIEKGKTGIKDARPGEYPMVVTAESRLSTDHFDFEGPAVIIPLVSSTGHGDASLKRIHYQDGRYAVGSILCAVQSRYPDLVHPRYLYEYLAAFKDELLVSRMSGTANVSLNVGRIADVPVPLITFDAQRKLERLMSLCDALEAKGQLEATQHVQLVSTLLATLTDSETPAQLTENWQRIATHFDLLLDRPEAVDALEQTILQLAVRGLLVPQDPQDEPASELLKKIRAEKDKLIAQGKIKHDKPLPPIAEKEQPFELPSGWEWVSLGLLTSLVTSGSRSWKDFYSVEGATFIRSQDIKHDRLEFDDRAFVKLPTGTEGVRTQVRLQDLLITITGANVGKSAVVSQSLPEAYVSQHVALVRLLDVRFVDYLHLWLVGEHEGRRMLLMSSYGAKPGLNLQNINDLLVPLPPLAEQSRIVTRVAQLRRLCTDLRQRLAASQTTQAQLAEALVAA